MKSNYRCAYDFQMPNGVDERSDDAIACTSRFCVQNTESFRVRFAETLNRFERNTFKMFYSIDHVKNFDAKLSRSALRSCDTLRGSVRIVRRACVDLFRFFDWYRFPYCYTSHSNNSILLLRTFHRVCLHGVLTGILPAELKKRFWALTCERLLLSCSAGWSLNSFRPPAWGICTRKLAPPWGICHNFEIKRQMPDKWPGGGD